MFTIITPSYNSVHTIERTIQSVLNQSYKDFNYFVVDGNSTDGTVEILKKYKEQYPECFDYISEPDGGIYEAMNKGIKRSTGKIIGIVNSDDFYEPDALETVAKAFKEEEPFAVYYGGLRIWEDGEEESIVFYRERFLKKGMICHPSSFVTKKVYDTFGGYSTQYRSASDYDFFLKLYESQKVTFIPIYKVLSDFTNGGISSTVVGIKEALHIQYKHKLVSNRTVVFNDMIFFAKKLLKKVRRKK